MQMSPENSPAFTFKTCAVRARTCARARACGLHDFGPFGIRESKKFNRPRKWSRDPTLDPVQQGVVQYLFPAIYNARRPYMYALYRSRLQARRAGL